MNTTYPSTPPAAATTAPKSPDIRAQLARIILVSLAAFQLATAQAQTQTVSAPAAESAAVQVIAFQDFYKFPMGPRGLEMAPALLQAHGKKVQLTGYMVRQENALPGQFLLTPRPVQMSEHADGEADDLPPATVLVRLAPEQSGWAVPHVHGPIALQGVLSVARQEAQDGRISWVQLQLGPQATRGMSNTEFATYVQSLQHSH